MPTLTSYNPDVLSCLANLSSDEVFTPPTLATQMLDLLPQKLWSDPKASFLDPACKTGVFLREIARRLVALVPGAQPVRRRSPVALTHSLASLACVDTGKA